MTVEPIYLPGQGTEFQPIEHTEASGAGAKIYFIGDAYDRKQGRLVKTVLMGGGLDARGVSEAADATTAGVLSAIAELRAAIQSGTADSLVIDLDQLAHETDDDPDWTEFVMRSWDA